MRSHTAAYTAVTVAGQAQHGATPDAMTDLPPGSYWIQPGGEVHTDHCAGEEACTLFIQMDGPFDTIPATP